MTAERQYVTTRGFWNDSELPIKRSLYSGLLYRINCDIAFMLRKQSTGQIDKVKASSL